MLVPLKNRGRWPSGKETIKIPIMLTRKDGSVTPFHNRAACEFVESDLFRPLIIDAVAFMVWPYMGWVFDAYTDVERGIENNEIAE